MRFCTVEQKHITPPTCQGLRTGACRSPHSYSVPVSTAHHETPQLFLDSVGVKTPAAASRSTPWTAAPVPLAVGPPPPPPPLSRALPPDDKDDDDQPTIVRVITGIVVMFAAAGLLLQLLWTAAPLPADPSAVRELLQQTSAVSRGGADEDTAAEQGAPAADKRSLQSISQSALRLSRRTLSWLQTVSVGSQGVSSQGASGSGHSSSSDRTRAASGRSELAGSLPESVYEDVLAPGFDASGSMHALSAQDFAAVGGLVATPVPVNWGSPGLSNSGVRSRHMARSTAADVVEGPRLLLEASHRTPTGGLSGRAVEARGSRHPIGTASPQPSQRTPNLHRPRSYEGLPSGEAAMRRGGAPRLVRRTQKVLDKCNIQGCPYRPRSVVAALLHPTAEFHYCYR